MKPPLQNWRYKSGSPHTLPGRRAHYKEFGWGDEPKEHAVQSGGVQLFIDTREMVATLNASFKSYPQRTDRALRTATSKFRQVVKRSALQAASQAAGIPQKFFERAFRYYVEIDRYGDQPLGVRAWIGTNPIGVHRLGKTQWHRRMRGARVGKKSYPGTWSWGKGYQAKNPKPNNRPTGAAVMRRISDDPRSKIAKVVEEPHPAVVERLRRMMDDLGQRYQRLVYHELSRIPVMKGRA